MTTTTLQHISQIVTPYQTTPPSFCYPGMELPIMYGQIAKMVVP